MAAVRGVGTRTGQPPVSAPADAGQLSQIRLAAPVNGERARTARPGRRERVHALRPGTGKDERPLLQATAVGVPDADSIEGPEPDLGGWCRRHADHPPNPGRPRCLLRPLAKSLVIRPAKRLRCPPRPVTRPRVNATLAPSQQCGNLGLDRGAQADRRGSARVRPGCLRGRGGRPRGGTGRDPEGIAWLLRRCGSSAPPGLWSRPACRSRWSMPRSWGFGATSAGRSW